MSNKFKAKTREPGKPEGEVLLFCLLTETGLEIHMPRDEQGEHDKVVSDNAFLLTNIAQSMAVKLEVDVDVLLSMVILWKKKVEQNGTIIRHITSEGARTSAEDENEKM